MSDAVEVPLHRLAHARAGDKGNRLNIALFAWREEDWPLLAEQVTEARVLVLFRHRGATAVRRYDLPGLGGFNFVIDDVLQGGVNGALNLDGHGKTHSFRLLGLPIRLPQGRPG
jgi:hypothetical protein